MRTKAEFKALRETVGMTQTAMAKLLGVEGRSVRRWESTESPHNAPEEAWGLLDDARARQVQAIEFAVGKVDEVAAQYGAPPDEVALPYWASQEQYDELHFPKDGGDYRMVNATLRLLAHVLGERGVRVRWGDSGI